jgi:adenine phosphoribosyltransferase
VGAKAKQVNLRDIIANYPDFPKQGILFRDVNPVFKRNDALNYIADEFYRIYSKAKVDMVAGIESRGFIIATALALRFGRGIVMVRKEGKLPAETSAASYALEYGQATIEVHRDAFAPGERVLIVGHSSGGHLALWAACRDQLPGGVPGSNPVVMPRLAVSQAGMVDLYESARRGTAEGDRAVADFLGGQPDDVPEVYRLVSPATYIPLTPRVVLTQGLRDNNADLVDFNRAFAEESGAELLEYEDGDHFTVIDPGDRSWKMTLAEIERALA